MFFVEIQDDHPTSPTLLHHAQSQLHRMRGVHQEARGQPGGGHLL